MNKLQFKKYLQQYNVTTWMQKVVKFSKHMIDCNPWVDTLLFSRDDFYMSSREQEIKLKSQIHTKVT